MEKQIQLGLRLSEGKAKQLKEEAKQLDISVNSLIKIKLNKGVTNS